MHKNNHSFKKKFITVVIELFKCFKLFTVFSFSAKIGTYKYLNITFIIKGKTYKS